MSRCRCSDRERFRRLLFGLKSSSGIISSDVSTPELEACGRGLDSRLRAVTTVVPMLELERRLCVFLAPVREELATGRAWLSGTAEPGTPGPRRRRSSGRWELRLASCSCD